MEDVSEFIERFHAELEAEQVALQKGLDSAALAYVTLMAQHSLCPDTYDNFCIAHDRLVMNRSLPNPLLNE